MNLHRASKQADWQMIKSSKRNIFQKLAAASGGVLTPGNAITLIGFGAVLYGLGMILQGNLWLGLVVLVVGRLLDIADGMIAEATKTKSSLGELVDAVSDKIGTFLALGVLLVVATAHWWAILGIILPQVMLGVVGIYKQRQGVRVHPTRAGKLSMALAWLGIVGLLAMQAATYTTWLAGLTYTVIGVSLGLGGYASWQYTTGRGQD